MNIRTNFLTAIIFVLSFGFINAMPVVEDGKMTVKPSWEIGDQVKYNYVHTIFFEEDGDELDSDTNNLELSLMAAEKIDDEYVIQAKYFLVDTTTKNYKERFYRDVFHNTKIYYKTKEGGRYDDLQSMNSLKAVVRYALEKNWKMFIEDNKEASRTYTKDRVMLEINKIMNTQPDVFIKNSLRVGELFAYLHSFYGRAYNMEDTTMFIRKFVNPMDESKKEHEVYYIAKINKLDAVDNIMDVTLTMHTDGVVGFLIGFDFFSGIEKKIEEIDDIPQTDIDVSMRFVVDLDSGWINLFEMERKIKSESEDAELVEKRTLNRIKE